MNKSQIRKIVEEAVLFAHRNEIDTISTMIHSQIESEPKPAPKPIPKDVIPIKDVLTNITSNGNEWRIYGVENKKLLIDLSFDGTYIFKNCQNLHLVCPILPLQCIFDIRECQSIALDNPYILCKWVSPKSSFGLIMLKQCENIFIRRPRLEMNQPTNGQYDVETDVHGISILDNNKKITIKGVDDTVNGVAGWIRGMYGDGIQIHGRNISDVEIKDLSFENCWENAIDIKDGLNIDIINNIFANFTPPKHGKSDGSAVCFHDRASQALIQGNEFYDCTNGLRFNCGGEFRVYENLFRNCKNALAGWYNPTIRVRGNVYDKVQSKYVFDKHVHLIEE